MVTHKKILVAVGCALVVPSIGKLIAAPACSNMSTAGYISKWTDAWGTWDLQQNNSSGFITGTLTTSPSTSGCPSQRYGVTGSYLGSGKFKLTATYGGSDFTCYKKMSYSGTITQPGCNNANVTISYNDGPPQNGTPMTHACYIPSGETTPQFQGWGNPNTGNPIPAKFNQSLQATNFNWGGRTLSESFPQSGNDTCYFSGGPYLPAVGMPALAFTFGSGAPSSYSDYVGMTPEVANDYRRYGRAPCGFTFYQTMSLDCPTGNTAFAVNTLYLGVGLITVSSKRAGSGEWTQNWGTPSPEISVLPAIFNLLLSD